MLEIIKANYLHDKVLLVEFNTGEPPCEVNFSEKLTQDSRTVFKPLLDDQVFKNFKVRYTLSWLNGQIDMAPEYIYFLAHQSEKKHQSLFKEWGYLN